MQTYARPLDGALEAVDEVLARIPEGGGATAPPRVLQQLEDAAATATAKFKRMDENYDIQTFSDELTEDIEKAHTKAYEEAKVRYKRAMKAVDTVFDARPVAVSSMHFLVAAARHCPAIVDSVVPAACRGASSDM